MVNRLSENNLENEREIERGIRQEEQLKGWVR